MQVDKNGFGEGLGKKLVVWKDVLRLRGKQGR